MGKKSKPDVSCVNNCANFFSQYSTTSEGQKTNDVAMNTSLILTFILDVN